MRRFVVVQVGFSLDDAADHQPRARVPDNEFSKQPFRLGNGAVREFLPADQRW
jgi:hypothetical protein